MITPWLLFREFGVSVLLGRECGENKRLISFLFRDGDGDDMSVIFSDDFNNISKNYQNYKRIGENAIRQQDNNGCSEYGMYEKGN